MGRADGYLLINIIKQPSMQGNKFPLSIWCGRPSRPSMSSATTAVSGHFQPRKMRMSLLHFFRVMQLVSFGYFLTNPHVKPGWTWANPHLMTLGVWISWSSFCMSCTCGMAAILSSSVDYRAPSRVFPQTLKFSTSMCCGMHVDIVLNVLLREKAWGHVVE